MKLWKCSKVIRPVLSWLNWVRMWWRAYPAEGIFGGEHEDVDMVLDPMEALSGPVQDAPVRAPLLEALGKLYPVYPPILIHVYRVYQVVNILGGQPNHQLPNTISKLQICDHPLIPLIDLLENILKRSFGGVDKELDPRNYIALVRFDGSHFGGIASRTGLNSKRLILLAYKA